MTTIVAIPGSLRKDSFNRALLGAIVERAPEGVEIQIEPLNGIPVYNGDDEEATGIPPRVVEIQDALVAADGLILATPEYNAGVSGVAKNAFDWFSRGPGGSPRVFGGLPMALCGATDGPGGTRVAQAHWQSTMTRIGVRMWADKLLFVNHAQKSFEAGNLVDDGLGGVIERYIASFASFCAAQPPRR